MHELAVCQDIIAQVEQIAAQHHALSVHLIELDIGPLSGVEPPLLEAAFPIASAGTVAENAELKIEISPIVVSCRNCNEKTAASANDLTCKACGNWQTDLVSGDEMILKRVELDT